MNEDEALFNSFLDLWHFKVIMILDISFFLNRYDDAIQLYDRILQEDPTNTVSLYIVLKVT